MSAIQKNWKYLAIGGGALVVVVVLIVLFAMPGPDISGQYELLVAGQKTETLVDIAPASDNLQVKFFEGDRVRSQFSMSKPRTGRFLMEYNPEGKTSIRFDLEVVNDGLKGTMEISSLAKGIDVYFRKVP